MQTFHQLDDVPATSVPRSSASETSTACTALTARYRRDRETGEGRNTHSLVISFEPHPARILHPDHNFKLLTPLPEKLLLLEATGIDAVLLLPFTRDLSLMTPRQLHMKSEEAPTRPRSSRRLQLPLRTQGGGKHSSAARSWSRDGFEVHDYPEMRLRGEPVSSSHIRKLLSEGRVSRARHLLASVQHSFYCRTRTRIWREIYRATINLAHYEELVPKDGVYVTRTRVGDECFDSVTNVGNRPTFGAIRLPSSPTC